MVQSEAFLRHGQPLCPSPHVPSKTQSHYHDDFFSRPACSLHHLKTPQLCWSNGGGRRQCAAQHGTGTRRRKEGWHEEGYIGLNYRIHDFVVSGHADRVCSVSPDSHCVCLRRDVTPLSIKTELRRASTHPCAIHLQDLLDSIALHLLCVSVSLSGFHRPLHYCSFPWPLQLAPCLAQLLSLLLAPFWLSCSKLRVICMHLTHDVQCKEKVIA